MTTNAAAFVAAYADWKLVRTRKVVQIVLEIPVEKSGEAFAALGGMPNSAAEVWCAVARLDTTKMEVQTSENESITITHNHPTDSDSSAPSPGVDTPAGTRTLSQLSGAYCSIPAFRKFLGARMAMDINTEIDAAAAVRELCGVTTRRDIKVGTNAGDRFEALIDDFHEWELADRYVEAR